jgi:hypothetical protein
LSSRIVFIGSAGKNDGLILHLEMDSKDVEKRLRESPFDLVLFEEESKTVWVNRTNVAYIQETGGGGVAFV